MLLFYGCGRLACTAYISSLLYHIRSFPSSKQALSARFLPKYSGAGRTSPGPWPTYADISVCLLAKMTPSVIRTAPMMLMRDIFSPSSSQPTTTVTKGVAYR